MGSWTNLTGFMLITCQNKCGQKPAAPLVMTPASTQDWMNKTLAYNRCLAECQNKTISGGTREYVPTDEAKTGTTTSDKGDPIPAVGYETKPAETKLKTSNILLIGLLVAVAGGVWYFTRKK